MKGVERGNGGEYTIADAIIEGRMTNGRGKENGNGDMEGKVQIDGKGKTTVGK